jgi:hypothetical protein
VPQLHTSAFRQNKHLTFKHLKFFNATVKLCTLITYIKFLSENLKRKDRLEDFWHRWEDNMNMDLREMGFESVDWIHLAQDRVQQCALLNVIMKIGR